MSPGKFKKSHCTCVLSRRAALDVPKVTQDLRATSHAKAFLIEVVVDLFGVDPIGGENCIGYCTF